MTIPSPTVIAETQKNTGSHGLYQRGESLPGAISHSEPSEDWCMVESRMPMITSGSVALWARRHARFQLQPFEESGAELERQHGGVGHHAHGDFEQHASGYSGTSSGARCCTVARCR